MRYTVMVKWHSRGKAERLGHGQTVTRKVHALVFRTRLAAEFAARMSVVGVPGVQNWWVSPF